MRLRLAFCCDLACKVTNALPDPRVPATVVQYCILLSTVLASAEYYSSKEAVLNLKTTSSYSTWRGAESIKVYRREACGISDFDILVSLLHLHIISYQVKTLAVLCFSEVWVAFLRSCLRTLPERGSLMPRRLTIVIDAKKTGSLLWVGLITVVCIQTPSRYYQHQRPELDIVWSPQSKKYARSFIPYPPQEALNRTTVCAWVDDWLCRSS